MPCKVWLLGDSDPFWLDDPADVVVHALEQARALGELFIRLDMVPPRRGEPTLPTYLETSRVVAVGWLDRRELNYAYEHTPEWLDGDA